MSSVVALQDRIDFSDGIVIQMLEVAEFGEGVRDVFVISSSEKKSLVISNLKLVMSGFIHAQNLGLYCLNFMVSLRYRLPGCAVHL